MCSLLHRGRCPAYPLSCDGERPAAFGPVAWPVIPAGRERTDRQTKERSRMTDDEDALKDADITSGSEAGDRPAEGSTGDTGDGTGEGDAGEASDGVGDAQSAD